MATGLSISSYISQVVAAQPRKPSPIHDAFQSIQNWASSGLVDGDISASAAIAISKTTLGTYATPAAVTPTFYKNDNSTVITFSTTNVRVEQIGKRVFVNMKLSGASAAPGFNCYFTVPLGTPKVTGGQDTYYGVGRWTGTGADASGSVLHCNWSDAGQRFHFIDRLSTTLPADIAIDIAYHYELN